MTQATAAAISSPRRLGRPRLGSKKLSNAEKQARYRERKKALAAEEARQKLITSPPPKLDDPAGAICQWASDNLVVPPGHPKAGEPMRPPEYIEDFLRAGWDARESVLSIGRKNSKSGGLVILALAYLAGPVKQAGFKVGVWSYSKELASNFYKDAAAVVLASGLELEVKKSPWPGAIQNDIGGLINIHSADTSSPHSLGVDLGIIDELGLWPERKRELVAGIRSAISAKDGRIVICSIRSTGPMMGEVLDNPETIKRVYEADKDCDFKDEKQWHKANPGLAAGIKSISHMRDQVARLEHAPQDVNFFKAHELNMPLAPTVEVLITPEQMSKCFADEPPEAIGPAHVGLDFGESRSATAATVIYPQTGLMLLFMGFGDVPPLHERARIDNAPYGAMVDEGTLRLYPGRITPVDQFLQDVLDVVPPESIASISSDAYKIKESQDFLDRIGSGLVITSRKSLMGHSADVRAFVKLVLSERIKCKPSAALSFAVASHQAHRDKAGNPQLMKKSGRIDLMSSSLIAAGQAAPDFDRPPMQGSWMVEYA